MLVDIRRVWAGNRPEWLDRHCQTQWTVRRAVSIILSFLLGLCGRVYERVSRIWFEGEEVENSHLLLVKLRNLRNLTRLRCLS